MQKAAYGEICGEMLLRPHDLVHRYALHYLHIRHPTRLVLRRNNKGRGRRSLESAIKAAEATIGTRKGPVHGMNVGRPRKTASKAYLFRGRFAGTQILYVDCVPVDSRDGKAQPKDLTVCPGGG